MADTRTRASGTSRPRSRNSQRNGGKNAGGKKIAGLPRNVVIVGGLAAVGGVAFFLWESHKSATGTGSTGTTTATGDNDGGLISGRLLNAILRDWQDHPPGGTTTLPVTVPPNKPPKKPKKPRKPKKKPDPGGPNKHPGGKKHRKPRTRVKWPRPKHGKVPV